MAALYCFFLSRLPSVNIGSLHDTCLPLTWWPFRRFPLRNRYPILRYPPLPWWANTPPSRASKSEIWQQIVAKGDLQSHLASRVCVLAVNQLVKKHPGTECDQITYKLFERTTRSAVMSICLLTHGWLLEIKHLQIRSMLISEPASSSLTAPRKRNANRRFFFFDGTNRNFEANAMEAHGAQNTSPFQ